MDEITQRLRLRLSGVTNEETDGFNDELADEFEHDINTLCVEDDYNLIDFEEENTKSNFTMQHSDGLLQLDTNLSSENTTAQSSLLNIVIPSNNILTTNNCNSSTLDKHLREGKQRIDTLLQKLSIIANDGEGAFTSRHVSGCSINQDIANTNNGILKEFVLDSRPDSIINPLLFEQLYKTSLESERASNLEATTSDTFSSSTSSIQSNNRAAPEGARHENEDDT